MNIGIGNEHEVLPLQVVLRANEVLRVTADGQFVWNSDADRMIEEGDFSFSPAWPHILRALRKRQPLTDEAIWRQYQALWPFHPAEDPRLAADMVTFARAIESAHGITGEKT